MSEIDRRSSIRIRLRLRGRVQGVGFRPFVYGLARGLGLNGWVKNDAQGVLLEVEGNAGAVDDFKQRVIGSVPPPAHVSQHTEERCELQHEADFIIVASGQAGRKSATILPELATCADCLSEVLDEQNRRCGYPFTNCTRCGPRFTIIRELPYDRPNTTMSDFAMCEECQREYTDPSDRRFHAQPNACPVCGPELYYVDAARVIEARRDAALHAAVRHIADGHVVAIQGLGGYHLVVDATNERAVMTLRERKHRWEKPLAVMVRDLQEAREQVLLDEKCERLLQSQQAPIVLCPKRGSHSIALGVAPDTPLLGVMLPCTPLHHLLLRELNRPVVATSGNLSEEPICIEPIEAEQRLAHIADGWLSHNRPIVRHMDDSVVQLVAGAPQFMRRARGYAPLPISTFPDESVVLALGGHQKNTIALAVGDQVFVSQHIGDLDNLETRRACERVVLDLLRMYEAIPDLIVHDMHPDYASTALAEQLAGPGGALHGVATLGVQHHHAHWVACLGESGATGHSLGVIWDGSGYGTDGTIWGSEFLVGDAQGFQRVAALKPYPLLGGESSARDPRRAALSLLFDAFGGQVFDWQDLVCVASVPLAERRLLRRMAESGVNCPRTSSMGRVFDAVAAIGALVEGPSFEGRAGMLLETQCSDLDEGPYPLPLMAADSPIQGRATPEYWLDHRQLIRAVVADVRAGVAMSIVSARLHAALCDAVNEVCRKVNVERVVISGGCFQNRRLTERCVGLIEAQGKQLLVHRHVPPNDGGLSFGQALIGRFYLRNLQGPKVGAGGASESEHGCARRDSAR